MPKTYRWCYVYRSIVDFRKTVGAKAWKQHRTPIDQVDIDNIKNVFLYNTKTNVIVEDLDFIDPVQGKIAGTAEQELSSQNIL